MPPKKRKTDDISGTPKRAYNKKKKAENGKGDEINNEESEGEGEEDNGEIVNQAPANSGEILFSGATNWDLVGRKSVPKGVQDGGGPVLWRPHRLASMTGKAVRTVISGCAGTHCVIITTEGKAYSWGRNNMGQLGLGDTNRRNEPTLIESLSDLNIVGGACGRNHTLLVTDTGNVFAFGDNKSSQLGLGNQSDFVPSPTKIRRKGPATRKVACGAEFSMIVDIRGNLYSFGLPEYGQLGHNTDGKYFVTSSKMAFQCENRPRRVQVFIEKQRDGHVLPVDDVVIEDVVCGVNHTLVMDSKRRLFSWGFGGYGRLGHSEQKDELVPRLVKQFDGPNRGAISIHAGSSFSLAVTETGVLMFWGHYKSTGEATMYPKPVYDLNNWQIIAVSTSHKGIVVAADDSLVCWGGANNGELCYGDERKTSSSPVEAKTLCGTRILRLACGYGHTLMIVHNETEQDKENIAKIPLFTP